ncbi:Cholesterol 25-hydroxylase (Cholesterol 25-monooxygenase) [Durusdinium trenchii]
MVAQTWQELHSWPALHWAMIEALVAAVSFVGWISWFFLLNEIPSMKGYRMVVREESHPIGTHCMTDRTKHRVWASFPVYVLSIFALHLVKSAPKVQSEAPSTLRLFSELILGIWAYDFIFYWLHLAMHKFPNSWHKHEIHHELKVHPICGTSFLAPELVVNQSLEDGTMQVLINILVQNLPLFAGLPKHKMSRLLHNILVTYLLSEAHSGLDLPWSTHRLCPKILGGAYRHEFHHHRRDCCFHQFFCYLDDLLGYGPPKTR